jgi:hypothetical protein
MYFIYPSFVLLCTIGFSSLVRFAKFHLKSLRIIFVVTFLCIFYYIHWVYISHPYQNVYFNLLAGENVKNKFDLDYWGLANTEAFKFILENDNSPKISINAISATPLDRASLMLKSNEKNSLSMIILPIFLIIIGK